MYSKIGFLLINLLICCSMKQIISVGFVDRSSDQYLQNTKKNFFATSEKALIDGTGVLVQDKKLDWFKENLFVT